VKDRDKTKEELINELEELRRRISELEESPESRQLPKGLYVSWDQMPLNEASEDDITETIDFTKLLTQDITSSGSFDIRGDVWKTTFGKLLQALPMPALLIDASHRITFLNQACSHISPAYQGVEGRPFIDLFSSPSPAERVQSLVESIFSSRKSRVAQAMLRIDSATIWCQMAFRPIRIMDERFILVLADDLTRERKEIEKRNQTEKELRESERQKQAILDGITTNIAFVNEDLEIKWVNKCAADSVGKLPSRMIGHRCHEFWANPDKPCDGCPAVKAFETKKSEHTMMVTPDGRVWDEKGEPVFDDAGGLMGVVEIAQDITDRKRAEDALRESEEKFFKAFHASPDVLIISSRDTGRIIETNEKWESTFGYKREEVIGGSSLELGLFENSGVRSNLILKLMQQGFVRDYEVNIRRKSGEIRQTLLSAESIEIRGEPCILTVVHDITERKRAEEALHRSEAQLSNAVVMAHLGHWEYDVAEDLFTFNDHFYKIFRTTAEEVGGYTMSSADYARQFVHPDDIDVVADETRKAIETSDPFFSRQLEHRMLYADGEIGYITVRFLIVKDDTGRTIKTYGVNQDITERKRVEEALRQSEQRFSLAIEGSRVGVVDWDIPSGKMVWSPRVFAQLGYEPDEFEPTLSFVVDKLIHPDDIEYLLQRILSHHQNHQTAEAECRVITKDGTVKWLRLSGRSSWDDEGRPLRTVGTVEDVTERKRAEEALQESEERYRTLFDQSRDGVYITTLDGKLVEANQAYLDLFGFAREESANLNILSIYPEPAEENRDRFRQNIEKTGSLKDYEITLKTKDGRLIDCLSTSTLKRAPDGTIIGYQGIVRDITAYKQLQSQLLQAQKMEAIGTLAGGIAHDFNNLLTVIQGFSEILLMETDQKAPGYSDLLKIQEAGIRGAELVRNLLAFSRKADIKPRALNLNDEAVRIEKLLSRTIPKMINIELHLAGDLAAVNADPDQMGQVLMNLAVNAEQAMPDGGRLTIATANITLDEAYCGSYPEIYPGDYVLLTVSDTGHGMDKETLRHIFEPFFTTKEVGKGTGLGLAMVYGIIKLHGGHIGCDSEPNRGSTLKIYLPAIEEDATERGIKEEQALPSGGTETILLVDDEDFIRDLGSRFLTRAGYTVIKAASGPEAVQLYLREGESISLVILDLIMPEMGGDKCLEEILAINSDAKIVISSGAAVEDKKKETIESAARGFVNKPFQLRDMLNVVREVLDSE